MAAPCSSPLLERTVFGYIHSDFAFTLFCCGAQPPSARKTRKFHTSFLPFTSRSSIRTLLPSTYNQAMIRIFTPIPVEQIELYVFDLDGTMVDSTLDLANSVNATLLHLNLTALPVEVIAGFVGNGVPLLLRRSLGRVLTLQPEAVDEALFTAAQAYFLPYYEQHMLENTRTYAGAIQALAALGAAGQKPGAKPKTLAICTNKPEKHSIGICKALGLDSYFLRIYGGDTFTTRKPDPEGLLKLIALAGATPATTVMIGDSKGDVQVARNAGAWSLGCAFGFGPQTLLENRPDVWVDSAEDWTRVLLPA